jgi:hypothetical protein
LPAVKEARMAGLDAQWKALQKQLRQLELQTRTLRGDARRRLKRVERRTRVTIGKAIRDAQPRVRRAVDEATRISRGLRAGVRAGTAAYRSGGRRTK